MVDLIIVGFAGMVIGLYLRPVASVVKIVFSNAWKEYKKEN